MSRSLPSRYPFSVIRARMRDQPGTVLDFAFGRHEDPPPEPVLGLLHDRPDLALRCALPAELETLAGETAAALARRYGMKVSPRAILPAPGGRAAMGALVATLLRPGDLVVVTAPGYPVLEHLARRHGARMVTASLLPDRGFDPDLHSTDVAGGSIALAGLTSPNNPTGAIPSRDGLREFDRRLGPDAVLFNDATYGPLTYDGPPFSLLSPAVEGVDPERRTIVEAHSLTKVFALGSLAVTFLVGDETLVRRVSEFSEFAWSPLSSLQIRAATLYVRETERVDAVREAMRQRITRLRDVLREQGFDPYPAQAGSYVFCPVPAAIGGRPVSGAAQAAERLLAGHGIAVVPWDIQPRGYLRFSARYLPRELEALAEFGRTGSDLMGKGKLAG